MTRLIIYILLIIVTFVNPTKAVGKIKTTGFKAYAAAGQNLIFPYSIRLGWNDWEVGRLSSNFIGASKYFPFGDYTYSSFALGVGYKGFSSLGIQVAMGFNWTIFWDLGLRGEIIANAVINGEFLSHGLLGVSYGF